MTHIEFLIEGLDLVSDNERLAPGRVGRVYSTAKYRKYKTDLVAVIRSQMPRGWKTIEGQFSVQIMVWTYKDGTNLLKAAMDAMEIAGVYRNDRNCASLLLIKHALKKGEEERMDIQVSGEIDFFSQN